MKPVDQEFVHKPEVGQHGDCQRAVIASLLELPIADVPHFLQDAAGDPTLYWEGLQSFCRKHGYAYLTLPALSGGGFWGDDGDVYHEISGPSPRGNGVRHAVVGRNGNVVFDPHPSRAGLAGDSAEWEYSYLVHVGNPISQLEMDAKHGQALQEIGSAFGLLPGADLHVECIAAVKNLLEILRLTREFDAALAELQIPQARGEHQ